MKYFLLVSLIINQIILAGNPSFAASESSLKVKNGKKCNITLKNAGLCASISALTEISRKSEVKFHLSFYEDSAKTKVIKLSKLPELKLWMVMKSGHGHGSEELTVISDDKGYLVGNAWFLMVGEWQVKIKVEYKGKPITADAIICVERKARDSHIGHCK